MIMFELNQVVRSTLTSLIILMCFVVPSYAQYASRAIAGTMYHTYNAKIGSAKVKFISVRNQSDGQMNSIPSIPRYSTSFNLEDIAKASRIRAAVPGSHLRNFSPPLPLGYTQFNFRPYGKPHTSWLTDGYVCSDGTDIKFFQVKSTRLEELINFPDCIQAGPMVIYNETIFIDGFSNDFNRSIQEQNFVCKTRTNDIIIGITTPTNVRKLASDLATEFRCSYALRLTGSDTAGLFVEGKIYGNSEYLIENIIAIQ
ncbi:MAG: hypothetical protein C0490_19965 [Marivirga sp.]|nr:hypothetical protein [Marivirga sp.]